MFRTTAPVRRPGEAQGAPATAPRVVRAARYAPRGQGVPYEPVASREEFFREMGVPYGAAFDRDGYASSGRRTSVELAHGALDRLGPLGAHESPEVVVVGYASPDFDHAELVASCLKRRLPGEPLSFALSDQGVLAPFSALRVALEYARRCGFRRLLLMVVDQSTQPFAVPQSGQARVHEDVAVALLIEWDGGGDAVRGMAHGRPSSGVFAAWDESVALVAGAGLDGAAPGTPGVPELPPQTGALTRSEPGQPCTGVWTALLEAPSGDRHTVVADYDRERDFLAYCMLDMGELGTGDGFRRGA